MKVLVVVKQKKNVDTFFETIRALIDRGHSVTLAVQERDEDRDERLGQDLDPSRFAVARCPSSRSDAWAAVAPLLRSLRDCVQYLRPPLRGARKLQARTVQKLGQELLLRGALASSTVADALRELPAAQVSRLEAVMRLAEQALPSDPLYDEFLTAHRPDVLLLSPVVHFGSAQADLVLSARRLGVPVGMLLFSWDNLSTKGCLHRRPDWMFVWNERQRQEAQALHGFPAERVVVTGAPRFDGFFALCPRLSREEFHAPLGLDPSKATLLYVCSSRFVSEGELAFVRRWIAALRAAPSPRLRECNVVVRPHPDVALLAAPDAEPDLERLQWPAWPSLTAHVARPFGEDRALVLRTRYHGQQGLYECIVHSDAVVGLNTSAELEASIVGRPVFTILAADEDADGQRSTLHFHYLLKAQGGFVSAAPTVDAHLAQLDEALESPLDPAPVRRFVESFLRPHGIEQPVSPLLAEAIERTFAAPQAQGRELPGGATGEPIAPPDVPEADGSERPVVPLLYEPRRIHVYATPEVTRNLRRRTGHGLDAGTVDWLQGRVGVGDVVYDIGAGIGAYALVAAQHRGATVVAFEPGYMTYGRLCDNLLLNGCDGRVIPMPLALADRELLGQLKYTPGHPGQDRHALRVTPWRERPPSGEKAYVQPVCTITLDLAVERYGLPAPNHLRLSPRVPAVAVLEGAAAALRGRSMKSVHVTGSSDQAGAVVACLRALGWEAGEPRRVSQDLVEISTARGHRDGAAVTRA